MAQVDRKAKTSFSTANPHYIKIIESVHVVMPLHGNEETIKKDVKRSTWAQNEAL